MRRKCDPEAVLYLLLPLLYPVSREFPDAEFDLRAINDRDVCLMCWEVVPRARGFKPTGRGWQHVFSLDDLREANSGTQFLRDVVRTKMAEMNP